MIALRVRQSAVRANHTALVRPIPQTTRIPHSAASSFFESGTLLSWSAPKRERISAPYYFQQVTHSSSFTRGYNYSPVNELGALAHAGRTLNHCLSVTSTLFLRSFTKERKSTPLFSSACARFRGNVGGARNLAKLRRNSGESGRPPVSEFLQ